jgi:hypothetical protein
MFENEFDVEKSDSETGLKQRSDGWRIAAKTALDLKYFDKNKKARPAGNRFLQLKTGF